MVIFSFFYDGITLGNISAIAARPIRIFATLLAGYIMVTFMRNKYPDHYQQKALDFIFLSITMHAVIMLLQFVFPDFKDLIYSFTTNGDYRSSFDYNFRMGGLSGGTGGAILSVVQAVGIILYPFVVRDKNLLNKVKFFIFALIIFSSFLVCGRSGLWAVILFLPGAFFLKDDFLKLSSIFKFSLIIVSVILIFMILIVYLGTLDTDNTVFLALNRTLDTFINFKETGEFNDNTTSILADHILFPTELHIYFIGETEHIVNSQFEREVESDIGYIRNLWSYGIFGTLAFVLPMITITFDALLSKRFFMARAVIVLSVLMLFFHLKESFLYARMLLSIFAVLLALYHFEKRDNAEPLEQNKVKSHS
ncbi:MAG: hypothetical protein VW080_00740 [Flavobacteriaceae bacterium]